MDYSKIDIEIEKQRFAFKHFANSIGITDVGLRKGITNCSMKVETLEKISEKLNIPMSYWWEEDVSTVNASDTIKKLLVKINRLENQIDGYVKKEQEYREEIITLKAQLSEKQAPSKRAV